MCSGPERRLFGYVEGATLASSEEQPFAVTDLPAKVELDRFSLVEMHSPTQILWILV